MPIYEYQCESCGVVEEIIQKMSDPGPAACGSCGNGPMVKLMSMTNFALKGSGWYVTDFRDKTPPKKENPEGSEKKNSDKIEANDPTTKESAPAESSSDKVINKPVEKVTTESASKAPPASTSSKSS